MDQNFLTNIKSSDNIFLDTCEIIERAQQAAYKSTNIILVQRNWLLGKRIAEEELKGSNRAEYGSQIINNLSNELTQKYGRGFTKSNLYNFFTFYKLYPNIFHSVSGKFEQLLSWTHYRILLQEKK